MFQSMQAEMLVGLLSALSLLERKKALLEQTLTMVVSMHRIEAEFGFQTWKVDLTLFAPLKETHSPCSKIQTEVFLLVLERQS